MRVSDDPFVAGARALRDARDKGAITDDEYDSMYEALARAAEQDSMACSVPGCQRAAYIGTKCARHTTVDDVRRAVQHV